MWFKNVKGKLFSTSGGVPNAETVSEVKNLLDNLLNASKEEKTQTVSTSILQQPNTQLGKRKAEVLNTSNENIGKSQPTVIQHTLNIPSVPSNSNLNPTPFPPITKLPSNQNLIRTPHVTSMPLNPNQNPSPLNQNQNPQQSTISNPMITLGSLTYQKTSSTPNQYQVFFLNTFQKVIFEMKKKSKRLADLQEIERKINTATQEIRNFIDSIRLLLNQDSEGPFDIKVFNVAKYTDQDLALYLREILEILPLLAKKYGDTKNQDLKKQLIQTLPVFIEMMVYFIKAMEKTGSQTHFQYNEDRVSIIKSKLNDFDLGLFTNPVDNLPLREKLGFRLLGSLINHARGSQVNLVLWCKGFVDSKILQEFNNLENQPIASIEDVEKVLSILYQM